MNNFKYRKFRTYAVLNTLFVCVCILKFLRLQIVDDLYLWFIKSLHTSISSGFSSRRLTTVPAPW